MSGCIEKLLSYPYMHLKKHKSTESYHVCYMKTLKKQQIHTKAKVLQITRIITNNIHLSDPYIPSINRVILKILPMQATNEINRITQTAQNRTKIAYILLHQIAKEIFEIIWKPRCTMIALSNPSRRLNEEVVEEEI
ncbi:16820_t:CDS:1, partial [Gigaspora margarita]